MGSGSSGSSGGDIWDEDLFAGQGNDLDEASINLERAAALADMEKAAVEQPGVQPFQTVRRAGNVVEQNVVESGGSAEGEGDVQRQSAEMRLLLAKLQMPTAQEGSVEGGRGPPPSGEVAASPSSGSATSPARGPQSPVTAKAMAPMSPPPGLVPPRGEQISTNPFEAGGSSSPAAGPVRSSSADGSLSTMSALCCNKVKPSSCKRRMIHAKFMHVNT